MNTASRTARAKCHIFYRASYHSGYGSLESEARRLVCLAIDFLCEDQSTLSMCYLVNYTHIAPTLATSLPVSNDSSFVLQTDELSCWSLRKYLGN